VTRPVRLVGEAAADLAGAVHWYEGHRPGLGSELLRELAAALELLSGNPRLGAPVRLRGLTGLRRLRLDRFPYGALT
jgi:plasmid stabilization system protein ParE